MIKKFFKRAGFGFILGIAVCAVITAFSADPVPASAELIEKMGSARTAILIQLFLSGLYGACNMGFTVLYEIDRLSIILATLLHCVICIGPVIPMSLFLGWFDGIGDVFIMTGFQLAAFFFIWLIIFIIYRKETRELNKIQKKVLERRKENDQ